MSVTDSEAVSFAKSSTGKVKQKRTKNIMTKTKYFNIVFSKYALCSAPGKKG